MTLGTTSWGWMLKGVVDASWSKRDQDIGVFSFCLDAREARPAQGFVAPVQQDHAMELVVEEPALAAEDPLWMSMWQHMCPRLEPTFDKWWRHLRWIRLARQTHQDFVCGPRWTQCVTDFVASTALPMEQKNILETSLGTFKK